MFFSIFFALLLLEAVLQKSQFAYWIVEHSPLPRWRHAGESCRWRRGADCPLCTPDQSRDRPRWAPTLPPSFPNCTHSPHMPPQRRDSLRRGTETKHFITKVRGLSFSKTKQIWPLLYNIKLYQSSQFQCKVSCPKAWIQSVHLESLESAAPQTQNLTHSRYGL